MNEKNIIKKTDKPLKKCNSKSEEELKKFTLKFRVNSDEYKIIQAKLEISKCKNMSEFLRRIVLDGYVLTMKDKELENRFKETSAMLSRLSANINQIAVRLHQSGRAYAEDITEIKEGVSKLWQQQISILSILRKIGL